MKLNQETETNNIFHSQGTNIRVVCKKRAQKQYHASVILVLCLPDAKEAMNTFVKNGVSSRRKNSKKAKGHLIASTYSHQSILTSSQVRK